MNIPKPKLSRHERRERWLFCAGAGFCLLVLWARARSSGLAAVMDIAFLRALLFPLVASILIWSTAHTRSKATLERRLSHDARATQDDFKSMLDSAEQSDDLALRKLAGRFRRQLCFKAVLGGFVSIFMVPVLLGLLLSLPS